MSAASVIAEYYEERYSLIERSLAAGNVPTDFAHVLTAERTLLEELSRPENAKLQLMTVLYAKSKAIRTVGETMAEVSSSGTSQFLNAGYSKRLKLLQAELSELEDALRS